MVSITRKGKPRLLSFRKVVFKNFPSNLHLYTIHAYLLIIFDLNYLYECLLFQGMVTFWLIGLSGIAGDVCIDFTKKKNQTIIMFSRGKNV